MPSSELAFEGNQDLTLLSTGSFAVTSMDSGSIIHMGNEVHALKVKSWFFFQPAVFLCLTVRAAGCHVIKNPIFTVFYCPIDFKITRLSLGTL